MEQFILDNETATMKELCSSPGKLERRSNSFLSSDTAGELSKYNIDKAFLAATGVSDDGGVTNSSLLELEVKQAAVRHCKQKYLLLDSTKFGKSALVTYATLEQLDRVITDEGLKNEHWFIIVILKPIKRNLLAF